MTNFKQIPTTIKPTCPKNNMSNILKISHILIHHHPLGLEKVLLNPNIVVKIMKKQS